MLGNFTVVAQIAYFCIRPNKRREKQKKFLLFVATFEQLSLQKATFDFF